MSVIINGDTGITTPAETVQGALTTTGNTILGDATTDTLNVGAGGLVKDASGNVGIGVTPSAWRSANKALQIGFSGSINGLTASLGSIAVDSNAYVNSAGVSTYITSTYASSYTQYQGVHTWQTAPSGTAGNPITFTQAMTLDASSNLKFNSGYGSAATAYGCRAWVNFNGTGTVAIRASGNVSSITDNAAGDYTVNFTTAMPDANYNVCGSVNGVGGNPLDEMVFAPKTGGTFSTSAVQIFTINPGSAGAGDSTYVSCSIFR
jgi:hypothetical protein